MADTKQQLLSEATSLVSNYPSVPSAHVMTSSAEAYYNMIVPTLMENFVYGFGIASFDLVNPSNDPDNSDYKFSQLQRM